MRFNLTLLILFVLTFSIIYPAWTDNVRVYVVDEKNRYVEGVDVTITYQRAQFPIYKDQSFDGKSTLKTNKEGYVDFSIFNSVENPIYELRYYFIEVEYGSLIKKDKVTCPLMGKKCHQNDYIHKFVLNTQKLTLHIKDQSGRNIEEATVTYNGKTYITDNSGKLVFDIPQNTDYVVVIDYGENKRTITNKMLKEDQNVDITFDRYNVKYTIIDDENNPIIAEVMLNDMIKKTDENGMVLFEGIISHEFNLFVRYEGGSKEFIVPINQDIDKTLVIDMNPPVISNVFEEIDKSKNVIFINCRAVDPNQYGSGLRSAAPVKLRYKVNEMGWKTVEMYTTGKDAFQATIPYEGTLINYEIEAMDAQENVGKYLGSMEIKDDKVPKPDNSNQSGTNEPEYVEPKEGISTNTLIIIGVVVLIIAFIGYKFYSGEL